MKKEHLTHVLLGVIAILLAANLFVSIRTPEEVKAERRVEPVLVEVGSTGMQDLEDVQTLGNDAVVLRAKNRVHIFKIENRAIEGQKQGFYR